MDLNGARDIKDGITCGPHEPDSVLIEFIDDEEDSYFDINLGETLESDEFEFQVSSSPQSSPEFCYQSPADELFRDGRIVPLESIGVVDEESSPAPDARARFPAARDSMGILTVELLRCRGSSPEQNYGASGDNNPRFKEEEVIETRKPSKIMPLLNGGITKLLIKFAPEKLRLSFDPTMKSYCSFYQPAERGGSKRMNQRSSPGGRWKLVPPFDKWMPPWKSRGGRKSGTVDKKAYTSGNHQARKLMISENNALE